MAFKAEIISDVTSPGYKRLTTMMVTYPLCIHNEVMTHRNFSRNSASSRAIPIKQTLKAVMDDPFIPIEWGSHKKGMQSGEPITGLKAEACRMLWLGLRTMAVGTVWTLEKIGLHKQFANRLLAPWMWNTVLITSTEWCNFFTLRCHKAAEPHMRRIAEMMRDCYFMHNPKSCEVGEWILPFITPQDREALPVWLKVNTEHEPSSECIETHLLKVSVGRCARLSYLTHLGVRDFGEDIKLHNRLVVEKPAHASPAEHQARALADVTKQSGNLRGFEQYRKTITTESAATYKWNGRTISDNPEPIKPNTPIL